MIGHLSIAAASYEGSLFSWVPNPADNFALDMTIGFHCSTGSLKAVAVTPNGRYMACGGSDEKIRVFNMIEHKTLGELSTHTGAITSLQFFQDSFLLSASEDNSICIWRVHDWLCVHILGGHKDIVNSIAIHPTGKLALSVSKDNTMKLWNLVQGRCAFTRRLKGAANIVKWNSDGTHYLIVVDKQIQVFAAIDNSVVVSITHTSRVNQTDFVDMSNVANKIDTFHLVCICENKILSVHNTKGEKVGEVDLQSLGGRCRDMSVLPYGYSSDQIGRGAEDDDEGGACEVGNLATIVTSNGKIVVLSLDMLLDADSNPPVSNIEDVTLASHSIAVEPRMTCVVCWDRRKNNLKFKREKSSMMQLYDLEEAASDDEELESKDGKKISSKSRESDQKERKESKMKHSGSGKRKGGVQDEGVGEEEEREGTSRAEKPSKKRVKFAAQEDDNNEEADTGGGTKQGKKYKDKNTSKNKKAKKISKLPQIANNDFIVVSSTDEPVQSPSQSKSNMIKKKNKDNNTRAVMVKKKKNKEGERR